MQKPTSCPRNSYPRFARLQKKKKRIKKKIKDALSRGEEAIEVERNAYRYLEKKKKKKSYDRYRKIREGKNRRSKKIVVVQRAKDFIVR